MNWWSIRRGADVSLSWCKVPCPARQVHSACPEAEVTHEHIASVLSLLSGKSIQHVNVTPEEVEKGLVAAGIPQFAARSVRELDEETSRGYQAIVTPPVTNLTGRVPMSVENFLQTTVPALMAKPSVNKSRFPSSTVSCDPAKLARPLGMMISDNSV
jgi:hypothetical protein